MTHRLAGSGASGDCSLLDSPKSSCGSGPVASSSSNSKQWLLVNDFHLVFTNQEEVQNLYGGRKSPCLLFFTKVRTMEISQLKISNIIRNYREYCLSQCNSSMP